MKKVLIISFLILIILFTFSAVNYAATPTLEQIADKFNNCSTVKEYATYGSIWTASYNNNKLTITTSYNTKSNSYEYTLENSILSANFSKNDIAAGGTIVTMLLLDNIGQLHGYSEGELLSTLSLPEFENYTLENEGVCMKKLNDGSYEYKLDIAKKIPLIDMTNRYITVSDLEIFKEALESNRGGLTINLANMCVYKTTNDDGHCSLLLSEKDKLTENTYKSTLSLLEVMFDSSNEVLEYFKENFPSLSVGNKDFTGFKIEINPKKTSFEESLLESDDVYEFVRLTIDKDTVVNLFDNNNETIIEQEDEKININTNNTSNLQQSVNKVVNSINKLPQTGDSFGLKDGLFLLCITSSFALIYVVFKSVKYKNVEK